MPNNHNAVTGAYKELYVVDGLGDTEETETLVGYLYDEFTVSNDTNEVTIEPNDTEIAIAIDTHKQISAEFSNFWVPPQETLEQLGLLDENGEFIFDETWDAARLYVYDQSPDQLEGTIDAVDALELPQFKPRWEELAFPTDSEASIDFAAHVNARPKNIDPSEV